MKKNKRMTAIIAAMLLLCSAVLMSACGGDGGDSSLSAETAYKVTVTDAAGNAYGSGIIARFIQNGEVVAMQAVNENGVAEKVLTRGDYTVELVFTSDEASFYYDKTDLTLTAEKTALEIIMAYEQGEAVQTLYVNGEEHSAYTANVGSTYVSLQEGRNYFLFVPSESGTYRISVSESGAAVGYYGAPHFVQSQSAAEVVDNEFTVSVSPGMIGTGDTGTSIYVLGVDGTADVTACFLNVERIGEHEETLADKPWTIYQATATIAPYVLAEGAKLQNFDLKAETARYNLVYNETDGFYHLDSAEGPLVLVRLGEDSEYLASFKTILENTGVNKYFFNENDEFVKKESYTDCLLQYIENMDETNGVYPLTEDLKYIIQQHGGYAGWWDSSSSQNIFLDAGGNPIAGINEEIAWLFMCCYIAG